MPYLKLQTNTKITDKNLLKKEINGLLMEQLGKPEKFIMIALESGLDVGQRPTPSLASASAY